MLMKAGRAVSSQRLDFGYHNSARKLDKLKRRTSLGWRRLGDVATIHRGSERTPGIGQGVVHTGNYLGGFWRQGGARFAGGTRTFGLRIRRRNLLVKRVSRDCSRSFGLADGIRDALGSDCVLVVRPAAGIRSTRLLVALRCLMALDFGPALLERGTGASYLAQGELGEFEVPYALSEVFRGEFRVYNRAVRRRCFRTMEMVESAVGERLRRSIGNS